MISDDCLPTEFPLTGSRLNKTGNFFQALVNLTQRIRDQCNWNIIEEARETHQPKKIWSDNMHIIMYVPSHPETREDTFVLLQRTPEEDWMTIEYASYSVQDRYQNSDLFTGIENKYD